MFILADNIKDVERQCKMGDNLYGSEPHGLDDRIAYG